MYIPAIISSSIILAFLFSWLYYVSSTFYWILLPGLKQVLYVFLAHFLFIIVGTMMAISRPIWIQEVSDLVWDNHALCDIHGRFWTACGPVGLFLTTLFSYYKMELYVALKENPGACITASRYSMIPGLIVYVMVFITFFIFVNVGPQTYEGMQVCATYNNNVMTSNALSCLIFLSLNMHMTYIFWTLRNLRSEDFPAIQHQMKVNLYVMPLIFFTSVFLTFVNIFIASKWQNNVLPWPLHIGLFDHIINNVIMYWSIFGNSNHDFLGDPEDDTNNDFLNIEMVSDNDPEPIYDFSADSDIEPEFWVCLPGAHPLKVTETVLEKNNLRKFIVSRAKRLRQIKAYKRRGFIPSLSLCCADSGDLMDNLDSMGALTDGDGAYKGGSVMLELMDEEPSKKLEHPRVVTIKRESKRTANLARNAKDDRDDPKIIRLAQANIYEGGDMLDEISNSVKPSLSSRIFME